MDICERNRFTMLSSKDGGFKVVLLTIELLIGFGGNPGNNVVAKVGVEPTRRVNYARF
jgi:hypothetical protein